MCIGSSYHVILPPHFAYGEKGVVDYVPGSAVLHIDFTAHKVWNKMKPNQISDCPNKDEISFEICDTVSI